MKTPPRPSCRAFKTVSLDMPQKQTARSKLQQKQRLRNRFQFLKTLGQGTYGKVKLAVDRSSGREVAIKSIRKRQIENEADLDRIRREIDIMSSVSHPHIISVYEVFENDDKIVIVMEYARGGELYDYISDKGGLTDDEARKFFRQIVSAVHYLHENGIVHRDLKLENIVLDEYGKAQIADFGLSNYYSFETMLKTFCGSPLYASPEIVNGQQYYGPEVDCWSLGVLLYTLVYGAMPFDGSDFKKLRKQISRAEYYEPSYPSDAAGLIKHLLTVNPCKRASVNEAAHHWWVNLGYKHTPIYEEEINSLVNVHHVDRSVSLALSSDSDSDWFDRVQANSLDTVLRVTSPQGILKMPTGLTNYVVPNEKGLLHHKSTEQKLSEYNSIDLGLSNHKISQQGLSFHVATDLKLTNGKSTEKKWSERKGTEKRLSERKGTEKRLSEHKGTEKRLSEHKCTEKRLTEHNGTEKRLSEHKGTEKRLSEHKGTEKRLSEHKGTEKRLSEHKGTEKRLSEHKGTVKRLSQRKGTEKKLSESKGTEKKLSECKGTEKRLSESKELESSPYPSSCSVTEFTAFCTIYKQSSQDGDEGIVSMDNTAQARPRLFSKSYESVFDAKKQPRKSILKNKSMEVKPNLSILREQYKTDLSDSDYYSKEQTTRFLQSHDCHSGFEKAAGASNVEKATDCNDDLNIDLYDLSDIEAILDDDTYASDLLSLNDEQEEEVLTDYLAVPASQELKSSTPIKYNNETQLPVLLKVPHSKGAVPTVQEAPHSLGSIVQEAQHSLGSVVQEAQHSLGSVVQEAPHSLGSIVQEAQHSLGSVVQEAQHSLGSVVQEAPHSLGSIVQEAQHSLGSVVQEAPHSLGSMVWGAPNSTESVAQMVPHSRESLFDHSQTKGILNHKGKKNQNLDVLSRSASPSEDLELFCSHDNCEQQNSNLAVKDCSRLNRPEIVILKDINRENHCLSQYNLDSNLFSMQCSLRDQLTEKLDKLNKPHCSFLRDKGNQLFDLVEARSVYKNTLQFCSQ